MKKRLLMLLSLFMAVTSVGWVHAQVSGVSTVEGLKQAIADSQKEIFLNADTFKLTEQLVINKAVLIVGNKEKPVVIIADVDNWSGDGSKKNLISIEGEGEGTVTLQKLCIKGSMASGINAQSAMKTILTNVTLEGNTNAGLLVHSEVDAKGLVTKDNGWGGVNVDKGSPEYTPSFTFDVASTFEEESKIWSEDKTTAAETLVKVPNSDWHFYVGVQGANSDEMRYWTNSKLTFEYYQQFPNKTNWAIGYTFIYANGSPITIEKGSKEGLVKISVDNTNDFLEVETSKNPVVFGGSKNATVASSKITMKSGKLNMLFGGGYGEITGSKNAAKAGVTGATTITMTGGSVTGSLLGGGLYYNHSKDVNINVSGNVSIGATTSNWLICGGLESGQTSGGTYLDFDISNNTVESATLVIDGGSYGYIAIGGTDGAKGYIKNSTATIKNATIKGGVFGNGPNGRSDKVQGTFTNCVFDGSAMELAAVNRGIAKSISLSFDKCKFLTGISANIGATYCWGYNYNGSTSKVEGVPGDVTFSFVGCENTPVIGISDGLAAANVTLTGAKAKLAKFEYTKGQYHTAFTIDAGKTWAFNGGLVFASSEADKATLTNNGTLNVKGIDNVADLQSAVAVGANSIGLTAKTFELPSHLLISKPMVIEGTAKDSTIIRPASNWSGSDGTNKNLIRIDASNTMLKNLLVEGSTIGSGIHVHKATGVTLDNVISRNNKAAGLIVNGSTVTATNFRTSGNDWYGVNVDKGEGVEGTPVFTIGTGCSFAEKDAIYADLKNASTDDASKYVVSNEWIMTKVSDKEHEYRWINAAAGGIDYAIISIPSTVVYGSANLPLISNVDDPEKVSFSVPENEYVSIKGKADDAKYDSLVIKKPGSVAIKMTIGDTIVSQQLEVLKRVITVSGIKAQKKTYDGTTNVTLNIDDVKVKDFLGKGNAFSGYSGTLSSANAGDAVPVEIKATFTNSDDANYYDVSYAAVTDTVTKAELTISTKKTNSIDYGYNIPAFTANESGFVNGETNKVLGGKLQFDCPATSTSLAGKYPVKPYGYTSDNYNIKYKADSLDIKAIAPTVELVSATVSNDKSKVTAKGRIISNGGTPTTDLKGGFMVGGSDKATGLEVKPDGTFSTELSELGDQSIEIKATAAIGKLKGTSTGTSVDLSKLLQNVNFVSELSRLTYGSTAQLSAKDFAEGAKVTFAIESNDASIEKVDSTTIKAVKVGTATITVTAEKEGCITAIAKQTVTVEPKNLTVTAAAVSKLYDGKLSAGLPEFTLNGIVNGDNVTVNINSVSASFIDKNVGENKPVVLSGDLTLAGAAASNYVLTQPTDLKGSIKQGANVKVIVSDVKRKYNETTLKYNLKFMAGETDLTSSPYTGTVKVIEENGQFKVSTVGVSFPNYGKVTADPENGDIAIEKGTPKVLTYNISESSIGKKLLDAEGWNITDDDIKIIEDNGKYYAQVSYGEGQTVRGAALAKQNAPSIQWNFVEPKALHSKAATTAENSRTMIFGKTLILEKIDKITYAVANTKVLTLTTNDNDNYIVNAVGVGTGAITATDANGAVAYISIKVDPKELTVSASGTEKTFDNTTSANVSLAIIDMPEGVSLDLDGVTFNYASTNKGDKISIKPSKPITLSGANAANYKLQNAESFTGNITVRELTITSPISKYYDGSATMTLSDYSAEGLIEGEAVPTVIATFAEDNNVGVNKSVTLSIPDTNYKPVGHSDLKGNIVKSTLDATLPADASSVDNLKKNVTLVVRETGTSVTPGAVSYNPTVSTEGSGDNTVYYISGGDNDNYSVVYDKNQIGYKANTTPPDGGGDVEETVTISLNASSKVLPRTEEFELTATVSPAGKTVEWSSSDPTIATVTANGNKATVKGIKLGKATITAKIGDVTATCLVTVDFATGIEEMLAQTEVYSQQGNIIVNPVQPLQLTIVNMTGQTVYNDYISGSTQIPARSGVYIVKLSNAGNTIISKLIVR